MNHSEAAVPTAALLEGHFNFRFVADQIKLGDSRIGLKRKPDSIDDNSTPVVATHDIHYDSHK